MRYSYTFFFVVSLLLSNFLSSQVLTVTGIPSATSCAGASDGSVALNVTGCPGPYTFTTTPVVAFTQSGNTLSGLPAGTYTINASAGSSTNNVLFESNFSNPSAWTLNQVTGTEGSEPNPWIIGPGAPYDGDGTCGADATTALYIQCQDFICELFGGGGPVFNASSATITDRAASTANNINTTGYNNINVRFAWSCAGGNTAYGSFRYSIDSGTNWIDLPAHYFNDASWSCETITLPATCNNISTLRIAFRWHNATTGQDPPFAVTNVEVTGSPTSGGGDCAGSATITIPEGNPVTLAVTPAGNQTVCPSSPLTLTAAAGYTGYLWSNGTPTQALSVTSPGTYSVTAVSSAGCDAISSSIVVTSGTSTVINVTSSGPLTICPGGSVILTADAGFTLYTWSNGQTGQALTVTSPGTYSVTGTGSGCGGESADVVVVAAQPGSLTVTPEGPLTICGTNELILTAAAGYTNYVWTGGATGQTFTVTEAGTYSVTADSPGGCAESSADLVVTEGLPFELSISPHGAVSFCEGSSVQLTAEDGYTDYVWSNSATGQVATISEEGSYSVSASNASGCAGTSDVVVVTEMPLPLAAFTSNQQGEEYEVHFTSANQTGVHYWNFGGNNTSNLPNPVYTFDFDATWPVMHVVTNDCGSDTVAIGLVVIKTAINDIPGVSLSLFPNPGSNNFSLSGNALNSTDVNLRIINAVGQYIVNESFTLSGSFNRPFDMSGYASGIYTVILEAGSNKLAKTWVKE